MRAASDPGILADTATRAARYLEGLRERRVGPAAAEVARLAELGGALPEEGLAPPEVLRVLDEVGSPATVASAGGRYFGFVIGSALPAALAADWLASTWDQNAAMTVMSPTARQLEATALDWIRDLLGLPSGAGGALVTGDTAANLAGLAAARHAVLERAGWDVVQRGLHGAPRVRLVVGEEVHVSVLKALTILGFGRDAIVRVPVDAQGRLPAENLPELEGPSIVITQAGNVNTGAFDEVGPICERAHERNAWVHVDGAFGLWARASAEHRALADGVEKADSWATDAHKWLNVPYDCGVAYVREAAHLRTAMSGPPAAYLSGTGRAEFMELVPEMSRRARGVATWAALRSLGRSGVSAMVERHCRFARRFAERLGGAGYRILNDVVLNQVLVSFGSDADTQRVVAEVQREGTCWAGSTVWHGTTAMRLSVSSWATTESDVEASVEAIVRIARAGRAAS